MTYTPYSQRYRRYSPDELKGEWHWLNKRITSPQMKGVDHVALNKRDAIVKEIQRRGLNPHELLSKTQPVSSAQRAEDMAFLRSIH